VIDVLTASFARSATTAKIVLGARI